MRRTVPALIVILALVVSVFVHQSASVSAADGPLKKAAQGQVAPAVVQAGAVIRAAPAFSGGIVATAADEIRAEESDLASGSDGILSASGPTAGSPGSLGCGERDKGPGNVRVNQDCSFRRQAEEDITYNPTDPNNLVGGQNDSRVGFNQCGIDWSTDNGSHWGDMLPPFRQRFNAPETDGPYTVLGGIGTDDTYDFASDPALAVDSQGRSYYSCVMIDVNTNASGLFVTQSPAGANGAFYFNVPNVGRRFIVAEDNNPLVTHDKNMISADRYATLPNGQPNPNRDNVYVTWTVFKFHPNCVTPDNPGGYCESPIFGSMSTDHALHWSRPEQISGDAPGLCNFGNFFNPGLSFSDCNLDQGSYSVVNPDGSLEVIFNNGNTGSGNPNSQQLGVHCMPAGDSAAGTAHLNCVPPVKVGSDVTVDEPLCNFGRGPEECIPGAFIRTNDYPRITKDNTQNNHLYAVWQDYRNGEFDIQMSQSLDGGLTWQEVGTVNPDRGLDHYFPATDQSPKGDDRNGVSYYRTQRVPNEPLQAGPSVVFAPCTSTGTAPPGANFCQGVDAGNSDYVLAGGTGAQTPYDFKVVSVVFPPPAGNQTGFNGDYSGLTINKGTDAHPIWSDTRNVNPYPLNGVVHDEDVFTDKVGLPNGNARVTQGQIGQR